MRDQNGYLSVRLKAGLWQEPSPRTCAPPPHWIFSANFDGERDVNQIIFDTDRPQVDLRVAQTMGTNNPVNWIFENNAERKDSIQMVSEGSKISVAAIRYGHAVVISFDRITGLLNWAYADGSRSFRYKCNG